MSHSNANAAKNENDAEEIDRIIQEIEEMEKKVGEVDPASFEAGKVVPIHPDLEAKKVEEDPEPKGAIAGVQFDTALKAATERAATTTSMPPVASLDEGAGLSLSVGGVTSINLEFARGGMKVALRCDDEHLYITTDSGAEFKVPFPRSA